LSSIALFENYAKKVGKEKVETTDIEADGETNNKNYEGELIGFFAGWPGNAI